MFKKTINELKDAVAETEHNVTVTVKVDVDAKKTAKTVIKTYAAIVGIAVAGRAAVALIDAKAQQPKKSED
jgi:hypothetical protein